MHGPKPQALVLSQKERDDLEAWYVDTVRLNKWRGEDG